MNKFAELTGDALENHKSGFLIEHWSVSGVTCFVQNEKAFEKRYIYKDYPKTSGLSAIIGKVYHHALMAFFRNYKDSKKKFCFDELAQIAHFFLEKIGADEYRPQKKLTIVEMQNDALTAINSLLTNFLSEFDAYEQEIDTVILVEEPITEWITLNGIDVPLPIKFVVDVAFINKKGNLCILDHKAKRAYTEAQDAHYRYSNQAIGLTLGLNVWIQKQTAILAKFPKAAEGVQEFFFYENKYTKNKDGSRQIRQIPINMIETKMLFEQLLFEGVFRMIEAVSNPDHVYLINPHDYFEDGEEILAFWMKTHIDGLEGFPNLTARQKALLSKRRTYIRRAALSGIPKSVIKAFSNPSDFISYSSEFMENLTIENRIEHRLRTFNYPVKVEHAISGFSCDTYLVQIGAGQKTNTIFGYAMDIANVIGVPSVRIAGNLIPYKGNSYIAIEVNRKNHRALPLSAANIKSDDLCFPIGMTNFGEIIEWDIGNPSTPHMMISGATGSGKSVAIRTLLAAAEKKGIKVTILDPKYEFEENDGNVINELEKIEDFMKGKVAEMDAIFKKYGARGHTEKKQIIIFDEAADCFVRQTRGLKAPEKPVGRKTIEKTERYERETEMYQMEKKRFRTLEEHTIILAQKARSAGIHLVLAAQRFSVRVLSGDAKANFPTRLCLTVASAVDSRVMLDREGAEKLNGKGDALFVSPDHGEPVRIQCFA